MSDETLDREVHLREQLGPAWDTVSRFASTISGQPGETIRPTHEDAQPPQALDELRPLQTPRADHLRFSEPLGQGGNGVVHLATQVSLGRPVAVKSLRPERLNPSALRGLVQEAWVTGRLEHPNVVPVHDMGLDADGRPLIVMKRIEGVAWGELLRNPEHVTERFGTEEVFDWHLGVLMQVCSAMRYAHSRGVVHRDLKPSNVMVGDYGEVYVVDWGIAVSLGGDDDGRLPLARDADGLAGTPNYMAPEMVGGRADDLSERTDVYLLGAILFELIEGHPPHCGQNFVEILDSVMGEVPELSDEAPEELAQICRQAMARHPADRFHDAEAFRVALQGWLDHRESNRLTAQAERRLAELLTALDDPESDHTARYKLFGECRFGFRQALNSWSDNRRARDGLRWTIRSMAEHELDAGNAGAANGLLAELETPPPALLERVEAVRAAERQERERLERLEREYDRRFGGRARGVFALILGLFWTLGPLAREWGVIEADYFSSALAPAVFAVFAGLLAFRWRKALTGTVMNRMVVGAIFLVLVSLVLVDLANALMGVPYVAGMVHHELLGFISTGMVAITVERRLWPSTLGFGIGTIACATWPEGVHYLMAVVNATLAINVAIIWWEPREA